MTEIYPGMKVDRIFLIDCKLCGDVDAEYADENYPTRYMINHLREIGWTIGKKGCICPRCKDVRK